MLGGILVLAAVPKLISSTPYPQSRPWLNVPEEDVLAVNRNRFSRWLLLLDGCTLHLNYSLFMESESSCLLIEGDFWNIFALIQKLTRRITRKKEERTRTLSGSIARPCLLSLTFSQSTKIGCKAWSRKAGNAFLPLGKHAAWSWVDIPRQKSPVCPPLSQGYTNPAPDRPSAERQKKMLWQSAWEPVGLLGLEIPLLH